MKDPKLIIALDHSAKMQAINFINTLDPEKCRLKVGKEMFTSFGAGFVRELVKKNFDVFLDLKFHDIPNTVAKAVKAAADLGVWMVDVHASGGRRMMEAANAARRSYGENAPLLIAVTVLTSMDESDLREIGVTLPLSQQVRNLALLAKSSGLDGVVCSALEAKSLRALLGSDFKLITPGIRPEGTDLCDQRRITTPQQAIDNGADYLVIGRPITQASLPNIVLDNINIILYK